MQKLTLDHQATRFILKNQPKHNQRLLETPFGVIPIINSNKVLKPSQTAVIGSESYRSSLSRAFNLGKQKIYFNPDLQTLVTLTYKQNMQDLNQLNRDIKTFLQKEKRTTNKQQKYLYVIEEQERGAYHIHMLTNHFITMEKNKNGYNSAVHWTHGFSSILDAKKTDKNFKTYLYMFKYMNKAQRIGKIYTFISKLKQFYILRCRIV